MSTFTPSFKPTGSALHATCVALLLSVGTWSTALAQEKVLRVAMTAADIPRTLGQPDQGFEGNRFTGIPMYDALTHWDLSSADKPSVLIPGLATSWSVSASDKTKWVFKLRPGVKFHGGQAFTADDVMFWWDDEVNVSDLKELPPETHALRYGHGAVDLREAGLAPGQSPPRSGYVGVGHFD